MLDVLFVGGGLQNGLCALVLRARQPRLRTAIVERAPSLGDGHTWSFHDRDVSPAMRDLLAPLVVARYPATTARFPDHERRLESTYSTISASRFDRVVRASVDVIQGEAIHIEAGRITLAGDTTLDAALVVDARGPDRLATGPAGYQKFVGLELRLPRPHGLTEATLMDATVPQLGGFRFIYALPLAPDRLLVEDTVFADGPELDETDLAAGALVWADAHGHGDAEIVALERGVLPLPLQTPAPPTAVPGLLVAGYQGGFFHPTTGYSLPVAARLAEQLAAAPPAAFPTAAFAPWLDAHRRQLRFAVLLNRLLFSATAPADRWRVLSRFYRLPEPTIARFYALETTAADRMRILCGRPPRGTSLRAALTTWREA